MGINTYNESSLHRTLKTLYSLEDGCKTEQEINGLIYDIIDAQGNIIEIQIRNLASLLPKITAAIKAGKRITIVHPLAVEKTIELTDNNGRVISKRKSPKKEHILSLFSELTGIYTVLLNEHVLLETPLVSLTEHRVRTEEPVQTPNRRRRFKKNWLKTDKTLNTIIGSKRFCCAADYLSVLPESLPPEFTVKELSAALRTDRMLPPDAASYAPVTVWVLAHMGLLENTGTKGKSRVYKINSLVTKP